MNENYLTVKEASEKLKVAECTVREWLSCGILPAYRIGRRIRLKESEIEAALSPITKKEAVNG